MLNLKKTAVAVLAFGSSAAFAGTMGPVCTAGNVTVPCERSAWDIGIQALYLKPAYNRELAFVGGATVSSTATTTTYTENDPDWHWGFKLEGAYHFSTGNDMNLNWYHLGGSSDTTRTVGAFTIPGVDTTVAASDAFTLKPRWDAVNLEFGQHVDFGEFKNIRFHGGVQYARIKTELSHAGTATVVDDGVTYTGVPYGISDTLTYNGFGPRIGADYSYDLGNGLAMYAKGATSILAGTSKFSRTSPALVELGLPTTTIAGSRTALVPELEAKLGLTYGYAMAQGDLTLDVGYMWVNYFNAQQVFVGSDSDFGLHGPYAGLKWVGTVV